MGGEEIGRALLLSLVTACIAFTVSETALFAPWRERLQARMPWPGKLVGCGYCLGCWIAFGMTAVYRPRLFVAWEPLDLLLTALAIAWLAAFQWALLSWLPRRRESDRIHGAAPATAVLGFISSRKNTAS